MQESMLIVPDNDNSGNSLAALRERIAGAMVDAFGGCTCRAATGLWRDTSGKLFHEPVTELVSACEDTPDNESRLTSLARQIGHDGNQLAVYCRYPSGRVAILDTSTTTPANDNSAARNAA